MGASVKETGFSFAASTVLLLASFVLFMTLSFSPRPPYTVSPYTFYTFLVFVNKIYILELYYYDNYFASSPRINFGI